MQTLCSKNIRTDGVFRKWWIRVMWLAGADSVTWIASAQSRHPEFSAYHRNTRLELDKWCDYVGGGWPTFERTIGRNTWWKILILYEKCQMSLLKNITFDELFSAAVYHRDSRHRGMGCCQTAPSQQLTQIQVRISLQMLGLSDFPDCTLVLSHTHCLF